MNFERFKEIGKLYTHKASISDRGIMRLSQGVCHFFGLNDYKYVQLFYEREKNWIGLKFVNERDGSVINVRKRGTAIDFPVKSLLCYYDIMPEATYVYKVVDVKYEGSVIIDLNTAKKRSKKNGDLHR